MKVAVTSRSFSAHPRLRAELLALTPEVTFNDSGRSLADAELIAFCRGHSHAVVALERLDRAFLLQVPELRVIAKYGVGLDNVDLEAAAELGVAVGWTGGVNRRSVAELTLAMAINVLRQVGPCLLAVRAGEWQQRVGRQLSDCTVGILGFGHVGQDLAGLLRPFGCRVLAHDIRQLDARAAALGVTLVDRSTLFSTSDLVSVHVPLDAGTRGLVDAAALGLMRQGSYLVNLARGGIVDEAAVLAALMDGRLAGAAFDVLAAEPPRDLTLINHPAVLVTPHIGGSAAEAILAMGRAAIRGLTSPVLSDAAA